MTKRYSELRGLMAANDYTQAHLVLVAGIAYGTLKERMTAKSPFRLNEAYMILKTFHIPASEIGRYFPPDEVRATPWSS